MINTLVIGASSNSAQYSHMAVNRLRAAGHNVFAIGRETFAIGDVMVSDQPQPWPAVHTITLYLNKERQQAYESYILSLKPVRIIFNPGAENPELLTRATAAGIQAIEACTLVMLAAGTY